MFMFFYDFCQYATYFRTISYFYIYDCVYTFKSLRGFVCKTYFLLDLTDHTEADLYSEAAYFWAAVDVPWREKKIIC